MPAWPTVYYCLSVTLRSPIFTQPLLGASTYRTACEWPFVCSGVSPLPNAGQSGSSSSPDKLSNISTSEYLSFSYVQIVEQLVHSVYRNVKHSSRYLPIPQGHCSLDKKIRRYESFDAALIFGIQVLGICRTMESKKSIRELLHKKLDKLGRILKRRGSTNCTTLGMLRQTFSMCEV